MPEKEFGQNWRILQQGQVIRFFNLYGRLDDDRQIVGNDPSFLPCRRLNGLKDDRYVQDLVRRASQTGLKDEFDQIHADPETAISLYLGKLLTPKLLGSNRVIENKDQIIVPDLSFPTGLRHAPRKSAALIVKRRGGKNLPGLFTSTGRRIKFPD